MTRPLAQRILPRRVFYGWYIAIACACLMFVGVGVGYYGLPIFLRPLKEEHGWTTAQVSWAPAIYFCFAGITAAFIGPTIDRRGPRAFMLAGMLVNGLSAMFIGFVNELWQLYLVYFVFAIAFGMSAAVATNAIMARWFVRKRAVAMSISSTGVSVGGLVLAPITSRMIDAGGLGLATPILGALVLVVALPVILFVLVWDPRLMGLEPDGIPPSASLTSADRAFQARQLRRWSVREAVSTVSFWAILVAFLLVLVAQTGYIIHQVSFLEDRLGSRSAASFTISLTALGSIVARLAVGFFANAVDRRLITVILFVVQAACVFVIAHVDNVAATWLLTLLFGFTIGNIYMMQSLLVGEIFGMVSFGTVFGLIAAAGQIGSGLGPIGVGYLHDWTDSYAVPFTVLAVIDLIAAGAVLFARPVRVAGPALETREQPVGEAAGG